MLAYACMSVLLNLVANAIKPKVLLPYLIFRYTGLTYYLPV